MKNRIKGRRDMTKKRSLSIMHFSNLQKLNVDTAEEDKLRSDLQKSILFGNQLMEENSQLQESLNDLEEELELAEEKLQNKEVKMKKIALTNENLEDQIRDLKSNNIVDDFEREQILSKIKEMKTLHEQNDKLTRKLTDLRSKYKKKRDKNMVMKKGISQLMEKIQMLEEIVNSARGSREVVKALKEKVDTLGRENAILTSTLDEERRDSSLTISKLKLTNKRMLHEFAFKLKIIQNNLGISVGDVRNQVNKLKKTFKDEMEKTNECLNDVFNQLIIQMTLLQNRAREERKELEVLKEKEEVRSQKILQRQVDEEFLVKWIRKYLKFVPGISDFTSLSKETLKDGKILSRLLYQFDQKKYAVFKDGWDVDRAMMRFKRDFGVEGVVDENLEPREEIASYVKGIYMSCKEYFDHVKKNLKTKMNELNDMIDSVSYRITKPKELGHLKRKRKRWYDLYCKCYVNYMLLKFFYVQEKNTEEVNNIGDISRKLDLMSQKIVSIKRGFRAEKKDKGESESVEDVNEFSHKYFKWTKGIQKKYFVSSTGEPVNEKAIMADYEDDEKTLKMKDKDMTENGKLLKNIWDCYNNINLEELKRSESIHYGKDELEMENDLLVFALKGITTTKLKELRKK